MGRFIKKIEDTTENAGKFSGEKLLGTDPETGKNIFVKIGRYGPMVQLGDTESEEKPKFAGLRKNQTMETITLDEALDLFSFPRTLGNYEDKEMTVAIGRFGPYVKHDSKFFLVCKKPTIRQILMPTGPSNLLKPSAKKTATAPSPLSTKNLTLKCLTDVMDHIFLIKRKIIRYQRVPTRKRWIWKPV